MSNEIKALDIIDDGHTIDVGKVAVGDVIAVSDNPVLDQVTETFDVIVNISHAREEKGLRAIRIQAPHGVGLTLTAAQAHQLAVDLIDAADDVADIRGKAGYQS